MRAQLALVVAVATLAIAGCGPGVQGAREDFSSTKYCPLDRVTAEHVSADRLVAVRCAAPDAQFQPLCQSPPADVAADPQRLALFRKRQSDALDAMGDVYVVRGCGHARLYMCRYGHNGVHCLQEVDLDPPAP